MVKELARVVRDKKTAPLEAAEEAKDIMQCVAAPRRFVSRQRPTMRVPPRRRYDADSGDWKRFALCDEAKNYSACAPAGAGARGGGSEFS